jgi:hypothetical protein
LRIDVTSAGLRLSAEQKEKVVRRVQLAFCRFGPRVRKVRVRLAELTSPLGGLGQRCRMRVSIQAHDGIEVEVSNGQIDFAVARAATRLAARVASALDGHPRVVAGALSRGGCRDAGEASRSRPALLRRGLKREPFSRE